MDEYKKPYLILFGKLADAIEAIEKCNFGQAKEILIKAQNDAEEEYINFGLNDEQEPQTEEK